MAPGGIRPGAERGSGTIAGRTSQGAQLPWGIVVAAAVILAAMNLVLMTIGSNG